MHVVYDELKDRVHVPLVSIPDAVSEAAALHKFNKVGLLGTIFTMQNDFFKKAFTEKGIDVVTPSDEDMMLVNCHVSTDRGIESKLMTIREVFKNSLKSCFQGEYFIIGKSSVKYLIHFIGHLFILLFKRGGSFGQPYAHSPAVKRGGYPFKQFLFFHAVQHACQRCFGKSGLPRKLTDGNIIFLPENEEDSPLSAVEFTDVVRRQQFLKYSSLKLFNFRD